MDYTLKNDGKFTSITFTQEHMDSALEYWTEERMENAIPADSILPAGVQLNSQSKSLEVKEADIGKEPFSAGGRFFFTRGGKDYSTTAQFCTHKQLMLTAVISFYDYDTGAWSSNMVFCQGYKDGKFAQCFSVRGAALYTCCIEERACGYNYAFGVVFGATKGKVLDYELNSTSGEAIAFGYSSDFKSKKKMGYVSGPYEAFEELWLKMPGNSRHGARGGAWVKKGTNKVIGFHSHYRIDAPGDEYSPRLGNEFKDLLDYAKTWIVPVNTIRYFRLHNSGGFVARIQVVWSHNGKKDIYKGSGYRDICIHGERTLDLTTTGIPDGATVQLKADVRLGRDNTAFETFTYRKNAGETASYDVSGTTLDNELTLLLK